MKTQCLILLIVTLSFSALGASKKITLKLPIHSHHEDYYITGNNKELCNWKPKCLKLTKLKDNIFFIKLNIPNKNTQFKVTKGNWSTEGTDRDGDPLENFLINANKYDQHYIIDYWKDEIGRYHDHVQDYESIDSSKNNTDILFVGSSSARLWRKAPLEIKGYKFLSRGAGGAHIEDIQIYFNRLIHFYSPKKIIFYIGENDLTTNETPEIVYSQFVELLKRTQATFPNSKLFCGAIKNSPNRVQFQIKFIKFNQLLKANKDCEFIDLYTVLTTSDGQLKEEIWQRDLIHLNHKGYELWLNSIKDHI